MVSVPTSELEPCQLSSADTAPALSMSPSRPIAPSISFHSPQTPISSRRTTFVSPSLFSPSISPLSWYDPIPAPPSPFIPHFTLSGSATQEATRPARNISEQLSGCLQGTLCTSDCLCYSCLSYCIVDTRYRWGWVLLGSVITLQFGGKQYYTLAVVASLYMYLCTLGSSVFALCAVYTNVCTVAILYMQTHCFVFCRSKARTGCGGSRG